VQRTVLTVDGRLNLPDDLVAFLEAGRVLEYPADDAEPGLLELRRLDQLELREVYYSSAEEGHAPGENEEPNAGDDPHADDEEQGYYAIPAVDLVAACSGDFPPEALLFWLPDHKLFGTWDGAHFELLVFPETSWDDIAANPLPYVNAQWSEEPPGYYLAPWLHGHPYRHGSPRYPSD
jgi:hypothetical protein